MKASQEEFATLKEILQAIQTPENLDDHPWVDSLVVKNMAMQNEAIAQKSGGYRLVFALGELFKELQPPSPPRRGKRLDTSWGRFGILGANYFAPLLFGQVYPRTLRDSWWRIDESILLFVYGVEWETKSPEEIEKYQLLGEQADFVANSTISDWHREAIQELADLFMNTEERLILANDVENAASSVDTPDKPKNRKKIWRFAIPSIIILLGIAAYFLGTAFSRIYEAVSVLQSDLDVLQKFDFQNLEVEMMDEAGELLQKTKKDLENLEAEASPWFWASNKMGWLPRYGGDVEYADEMLLMASGLIDAAEYSYNAGVDILTLVQDNEQDIKAYEITKLLLEKETDFLLAKNALEMVSSVRADIDEKRLSGKSARIIAQIDKYLPLMNDGLTTALSLPDLLGATSSGPKTYLILIQNEDELRPTGGFITSVANVVIRNGELVSLQIQDSYDIDDPDKLYPLAPWQFDDFMNIQAMTFRDSNWFSDYPTTVLWAEYLYAKTNAHSVDGVIAINQHVLVQLLNVTGQIYVPDIKQTISSKNVLDVMRNQKEMPSLDERDADWHRKQFMQPIASAILQKFLEGENINWEKMFKTMLVELDQSHILVQLDDPALSELLASRNWDGAIRNTGGDYLMVVDTNMGYNKVNALVTTSYIYDVDLTNITAPQGNLTVIHENNAQVALAEDGKNCIQRPQTSAADIVWYAIHRCYHNYLRVYRPLNTVLTGATPHAVSRDDMLMLYADVPARVDLLNEEIENVQAFGTLLVVPIEESMQTGFEFALPADILQEGKGAREKYYHLTIQKQPGWETIPVTLRIHLPNGAKLVSTSEEGIIEGDNLLYELELKKDINFDLVFIP